MNAKARAICDAHRETVCATGCPLRKPCNCRPDDSRAEYVKRMNKAAEEFEKSYEGEL